MESLFIQLLDDVYISISKPLDPIDPNDWFCGPGSHIVIRAIILCI